VSREKQPKTAKVRAAICMRSEKVTAASRPPVADGVDRSCQISRNISRVVPDAEAFLRGHRQAGVRPSSINEPSRSVGSRPRAGRVVVTRAKSNREYLGKLVATGAKTPGQLLQGLQPRLLIQDSLIQSRSAIQISGPLRRGPYFQLRRPLPSAAKQAISPHGNRWIASSLTLSQ